MSRPLDCLRVIAIATLGLLGAASTSLADAQGESRDSFRNPLLPSGPDPWVVREQGYYYYMHTLGNRLAIWRTRDIADLANAEQKTIWTPPASGPNAIS